MAVFAERHFVITKLADAQADTTETMVAEVAGDERLDELVRMLGGEPGDLTARRPRPRAARAGALGAGAIGSPSQAGARPRRVAAAAPESLSAPRPLVYLLPEVTQGSPDRHS